jgi:hypothetical protein
MRIVAVTCTELFVGDPADPRQVIRVDVDGPAGELRIEVTGDGVAGRATVRTDGGPASVEVGVAADAAPGTVIPIRVAATIDAVEAIAPAEFVAAEPGWTVWMVSHFHYDPVWWNTQAAYTATWGRPEQLAGVFRMDWQHTGFDLVGLHLETARRDPNSTTSNRTGTLTRRTGPTCGPFSPRVAWN